MRQPVIPRAIPGTASVLARSIRRNTHSRSLAPMTPDRTPFRLAQDLVLLYSKVSVVQSSR